MTVVFICCGAWSVLDCFAHICHLHLFALTERLQGTVIDLHVRAKRPGSEINSLFQQSTKRDSVQSFGMLIKSFGKHDQAPRATKELHRMIQHSRVRPEVSTFCTVIDAWAESTRPDATERALEVFSLMEKQGIAADVIVFGSLMKCIARSRRNSAGREAEDLLSTMRQRRIKPNDIVFNLAISACYRSKDFERAESIMSAMEQSDTPPDLITYSEILTHFAKRGTAEAAQRCEAILKHVQSLAETNPAMKPNAYTYSIVISAWARCTAPYPALTERLWNLYQQMTAAGVSLDSVCYNQLINFLSNSKKVRDLQRADDLLKTLEESGDRHVRPDALNYFAVMKGESCVYAAYHFDISFRPLI